jgi:hypothetical protein
MIEMFDYLRSRIWLLGAAMRFTVAGTGKVKEGQVLSC